MLNIANSRCRQGVAHNAVILGSHWLERKLVFTSLTINGEVWTHVPDDVLFDVPSFISAQLAQQCGRGLTATTKSELEARVQVLKKLKEVYKMCDDAMNAISSKGLDVYATVRATKKDQWAETTVSEVATLMMFKPTFAHILSAHKYLASNPIFFVVPHDYITSRKVLVRPLSDVRRMKQIREWSKGGEGHEHITSFVAKVKRILSTRAESSDCEIGTPTMRVASHTWSPSDMEIIIFLLQYLHPASLSQLDPFLIGVQYIVKLVYDKDVNDDTVHRLLVDIGAIAPWQDLAEISESLKIDLDRRKKWEEPGGIVERVIRRLSGNNNQAPPYTPVGQVLGPEDFYPTDPAFDIRHDFGSLPVYIVDDIDAKELDDGVSIEHIPSDPSQAWVHIHIADPTSLLPPTHLIAKHAELTTDSMYMYHKTFTMLPKSLTHHPERGLSLSCTPGKPQNTLSFSIKVDLNDGTIRDYVVRPGLVRNLQVLSYDEANRMLGLPIDSYTYPFGGAPKTIEPKPSSPLEHTMVNDLKSLYKLTRVFVAKRFRDGIFTSSRTEAQLYDIEWPTIFSPPPSFTLPPLSTGSSPSSTPAYTAFGYTGFPSMSYRVGSHSTSDSGAHSLIAEVMKLAARVASMYARDRDLPLLRRAADRPLVTSEEALQDLLDNRLGATSLNPLDEHSSYLPLTARSIQVQGNVIAESSAVYTTSIQGHWGLGIPSDEGYTRCTSPLRRYSDLVMHWQLKHALIAQAKGVKGRGLALYSKEELDALALRIKAAERFKRRVTGMHSAFWHTGWLMRFLRKHDPENFEFNSGSLTRRTQGTRSNANNPFNHLKGITLGPPQISGETRRWQVQVGLFDIGAKAIVVDATNNIETGTELDLKVHGMRLGVRPSIQLTLK